MNKSICKTYVVNIVIPIYSITHHKNFEIEFQMLEVVAITRLS